MAELAFVIPGHYKIKGSELSDKSSAQVIRVLGEAERDDYFLLQDGREMHETTILDQYEFVPTSIKEDGKSLVKMGDISELSLENIGTSEATESKVEYFTEESNYKNVESSIKIHKPLESPEAIFNRELLKKFQFPNNQKKSFQIVIDLETIFDLDKIKSARGLFDLNLNEISNVLYGLNDVSIKKAFLSYLTEEIKIEPKKELAPIIEIKEISDKQEIIVEEKIAEEEEAMSNSDYSKLLEKYNII